MSYILV